MSDPVPGSAFDRELEALVGPRDHRNPQPATLYDLVVLGGGTAGLVAAAGASGLGAKVALVERSRLGGDCLLVGCVPSKALLASAERAARIATAASLGVGGGPVEVRFAEVMERLRRRRAEIARNDSVARFRDRLGVDVFLGTGRFTSPRTIAVDGTPLPFRRALIATGGRPRIPPVEGLSGSGFRTNETIFDLNELPPRLAVLGAGPVGCELAQAFVRLGSRVILISNRERILPREEEEAALLVESRLRAEGVDIRLSSTLRRVVADGAIRKLELAGSDGVTELVADELLVATGRLPNLEELDLDRAGVRTVDGRLVVDDRLRTTNRRVFASGDVDGRYLFTHAADAMSRVVLQNALFPGPRRRLSSLVVPRVTYTDPEIAAIGPTEDELRQRGQRLRIVRVPFAEVDRAVVQEATEGYARLITDEKKGRILAATIVGESAGELVGEVAVAIAGGVTLGRLAGVIHPYPTRAEILRKAGDAWNRQRLTPFVRRVLSFWFRLTGAGRR
ncbi:MAG: mercuric reductase [Thermoanaerobaculia bacterium]